MINRSALLIGPAQPYLDWAASLDDSGLVPDPTDERTIYLVPAIFDHEQQEKILESVYETIFEQELFNWHTEEIDWPQNRTLAMFKAWFSIEISSVIEDLVDAPLLDTEN